MLTSPILSAYYTVTMQGQSKWPSDFDSCKDKFLIQSVVVSNTTADITSDLVSHMESFAV